MLRVVRRYYFHRYSWQCSECTLRNRNDLHFCTACDTARPVCVVASASNGTSSSASDTSKNDEYELMESRIRSASSSISRLLLKNQRTSWTCSACASSNPCTRYTCDNASCRQARSVLTLRPDTASRKRQESYRTADATGTLSQGETELMKDLRLVEESEARNRW